MTEQTSPALVRATSFGGEGPDLLMLHGFGADRVGWIGTAPALLPFVQCWVLDLPGHGESRHVAPAATLSELALQIDTATLFNSDRPLHLMGHSMGGALCLLLAASNPEAVASITLIAPLGLGQGVNQSFIEQYPTLNDTDGMRSMLETLVFDPELIADALVTWALKHLDDATTREALTRIGHAVCSDSTEIDAAIESVINADIPRLVVWGLDDRINPAKTGDEQYFGGQWLYVPQCGHLPHVESRKAVCTEMSRFLSSQLG